MLHFFRLKIIAWYDRSRSSLNSLQIKNNSCFCRYHFYKNEWQNKGRTPVIHGCQGMTIKSGRLLNAELWFEEIVNSLGNVMLDYDKKELPACYTIRKIHKMYLDDMKGLQPLSLSQFRRMWRTSFKEVIIPKVCRERISERNVHAYQYVTNKNLKM